MQEIRVARGGEERFDEIDVLYGDKFDGLFLKICRPHDREWLKSAAESAFQTLDAFGDTAHDTSADYTPRDEVNGFKNIQPRWLYADFRTPIGLFRVGQQPNHWGLGVLANDGDHPTLFGDYRYGSIAERILFATKPGGKDSEVTVALAGDLIYRDNNARLTRGDHAFQGLAAILWEHGPGTLGLWGVYRNQTNDKESGASYRRRKCR